ncbi:MAG: phosphate ABC transporter permease PstA [Phycisphaeraceae bacterium]|nr:phosphate ABC transporter permease PstA [Phycisphaeraceae bacterium]
MAHTVKELVRRNASNAMFAACAACALAIVVTLGLVVGYLVSIGGGALTLDFFTKVPSGDVADPGGMKSAVLGTLVLVGMAAVVGVPMGMGAGIYLSEYASDRWLVPPVRFISDVLTGVPSIVVGILGYELVVVPMGSYSGWAGAAALAFIMVPIVARTTEEMLRLVPDSYRAASYALGANKAQTIAKVVLPAGTGSLVTGIMLALARVAGETAPLLFTALGTRLDTLDPSRPFPSLTVQIYTYATGPYPEQKKLAWAGILVLVAMLFVLNVSIRYVTARSVRRRMM